MCGERALIIRGEDGTVRAFHNVCRHRGSRVAVKAKGQCRSALVCPFHGWSYNLDGTLRGPARPKTLPKLDPVEFGRSEEHTSELQSLMRISYAVFCLKKKKNKS